MKINILTFLILTSLAFPALAEKANLLKACEEGESVKVKKLISQKVDLNQSNELGKTCLMQAIEFDHEVIFQTLLLNKEVNINQVDKNGISALWLAAELDRKDLISSLLKKGAKTQLQSKDNNETLFHVVARTGNQDLLAKIIEQNPNDFAKTINQQNSLGESPLMTAIVFRQREMVRSLVIHGADKNLKNKEGKTSFDLAKDIKDDLIQKILLKGK